MADLLTIGAVAERSGVPRSTLRYYDEIGLLPPATRVAGQRRYSEASLRRLRTIAHCREAGLTLEDIREVLDSPGDWQTVVRTRLTEHRRRIDDLRRAERLLEAALACACERPEACGRTAAAPEPEAGSAGLPLTDPTGR